VVLNRSGRLHEWNDRMLTDWQADSVEATELALVVGPQKRTLLQIQYYPSGAPPVRRYRYDVDVWLVEAKTGKELASKRFTTEARPIRPLEVWDLTELGEPVEPAVVMDWMQARAAAYAEQIMPPP
jgi:hypothetical protein